MEYSDTTGSLAHKAHVAQRTIVDYSRRSDPSRAVIGRPRRKVAYAADSP